MVFVPLVWFKSRVFYGVRWAKNSWFILLSSNSLAWCCYLTVLLKLKLHLRFLMVHLTICTHRAQHIPASATAMGPCGSNPRSDPGLSPQQSRLRRCDLPPSCSVFFFFYQAFPDFSAYVSGSVYLISAGQLMFLPMLSMEIWLSST